MTGVRKQTFVLFAIFLGSVGVLWGIQSRINPDLWFYEIDPMAGTISGCENDVYELTEKASLLQRAENNFELIQWNGHQLQNTSSRSIDGCVWLPTREGEPRQMRCLEFPANQTRSHETLSIFFESESQCWNQRDLHYVIQIEHLVERNSPEHWLKRISNLI